MSRCGCAGTCTCNFKEGRGIALSGQGTKTHPILVEVDGQTHVIGMASGSVLVNVTGRGTTDDPYVVSMDKRPDAQLRPIVVRFAGAGVYSWAKPAFGSALIVDIAGAGGGGGTAPATSPVYPNSVVGLGGEGGKRIRTELLLADLPADIPIVLGAGGAGGIPGVSLAADGVAGAPSSFNGISARGGEGGVAAIPIPPRPVASPGAGGDGGMYMGNSVLPQNFGSYGGGAYPWDPAPSGPYANGYANANGLNLPLSLSGLGRGGAGGRGYRRRWIGNIVPNPSFELNTAGWVAWTGADFTVGRVTGVDAPVGSYAASVTSAGGTTGIRLEVIDPRIALPAGGIPYTFSLFLKSTIPSGDVHYALSWWRANGTSISGTTAFVDSFPTSTSWQRASLTATAPVDAASAEIHVIFHGPDHFAAVPAGQIGYIDGVMIENSSTMSDYAEGYTVVTENAEPGGNGGYGSGGGAGGAGPASPASIGGRGGDGFVQIVIQ